MTEPRPRGPYLNEDGDWWVVVEDVPSMRAAREHVLDHLSYDVPDDGRLAYVGKSETNLCDGDHAVGPECDSTCSRFVLAYRFEERRRW